MCGRYTITQVDGRLIAEQFGVREAAWRSQSSGASTSARPSPCRRSPAQRAASGSLRTLRWGSCRPGPARSAGATSDNVCAPRRCSPASPFAEPGRPPRAPLPGGGHGRYEWLRRGAPARRPDPVPLHGRRRRAASPSPACGTSAAWAGRTWRRRAWPQLAANDICAPVHTGCPASSPPRRPRRHGSSPTSTPRGPRSSCVPLDAARTRAAPANPAVNRAGVEGPETLSRRASPTSRRSSGWSTRRAGAARRVRRPAPAQPDQQAAPPRFAAPRVSGRGPCSCR